MENCVNMGKVLKMIADWSYAEKPEGTRDYNDISVEERDWNSWWYLHGELEGVVHYDKATVTNCLSGGFAKETINFGSVAGDKVESLIEWRPRHMMCFDGVVDVEIEGIDKLCKGYFWTDRYQTVYWEGKPYKIWEQRGLVCFADDTEACEYAMRKMREKCYFI